MKTTLSNKKLKNVLGKKLNSIHPSVCPSIPLSIHPPRGRSRISGKGFICIKVCVCGGGGGVVALLIYLILIFLKYPMKMK